MKVIFGVLVIFLFLILSISGCTQQPVTNEDDDSDNQLIGGDKDEHGCLIAAGYSWCESKQKCLRTWEEECPQADGSVTEEVNSEISDMDSLQEDLNDSEMDNLEGDLANLDW
ncbi:MAG: hypothetical protein JW716_00085 [Candidatus Aenigmarchaeota archaeon]|nr:hypothetical protein [Candidatus Aenigmarchaeota archaeon]